MTSAFSACLGHRQPAPPGLQLSPSATGYALLYLFLTPSYLVPHTSAPGKGRTKTPVILHLFSDFQGWAVLF